MPHDDVLRVAEPQPHVRELWLNRPAQLNAFNGDLKSALAARLGEATADPDVRVVVIRGEGRAFSVGADVNRRPPGEGEAVASYSSARSASDDYEHLMTGTIETFLEVWRAPIPVIAQVHGYCMGIGMLLANCCDLVFCAEDTVVGWPGAPLGGGMLGATWAHYVSAHKAKELSYTVGARLSGTEAAALGFANAAVPSADLDEHVSLAAGHIARLSRDLLRVKKAAVNSVQSRQGFEETVRMSAAWDALAHDTEIVAETRARIVREGLKPVLADWRPPSVGGGGTA